MARRSKRESVLYDFGYDEFAGLKAVPDSEVPRIRQTVDFHPSNSRPSSNGTKLSSINDGLNKEKEAFYGDVPRKSPYQKLQIHHVPQHPFQKEHLPPFILDFTAEPLPLDKIYHQARVFTGYVVTHKIDKVERFVQNTQKVMTERSGFSFCVMTAEKQLFRIPAFLTNEPQQKLNVVTKWRTRFQLEFGDEISFVCFDKNDPEKISNYRKDCAASKDKTETGNEKNIPTIKVKCVISKNENDNLRVFTDKFGLIELPDEFKRVDTDVAYEAFIGFKHSIIDEKHSINMTLMKIVGLCESQNFSAPWNEGHHPVNLYDQFEIAESEENSEIIGEKLAFRFSMREVLLLGNPDYMKPLRLPYKSEDCDKCPVGSVCRIDYMKHAKQPIYLVRSMTMDSESPFKTETLINNEKIFTIALPISCQWYGFYYHPQLGVVADSQGLLGFLPYSDERLEDIVSVKVKVTLNLPCLFDIHELTDETASIVQASKPEKLIVPGMLKSCETGAFITRKYPRLKLFLHPNLKRKFKPGMILETEFHPNETGQRFISIFDENLVSKSLPDENYCLQIKPDYCLFLLSVNKVEITEKLSKKTQKKKRIEQPEPPKYSDFETHFQNFLYRETGIISAPNNRRFKELNNKMTNYAILETNWEPGCQTDFNFVGFFDKIKDKFTLENPMIQQHLKKIFPEVKEETIISFDDTMSVKSGRIDFTRPESSNSIVSERNSIYNGITGRISRNQMHNNVYSPVPIQFDERQQILRRFSETSNNMQIQEDFDDRCSIIFDNGSISSRIQPKRNMMDNFSNFGRRNDSENGNYSRRQTPTPNNLQSPTSPVMSFTPPSMTNQRFTPIFDLPSKFQKPNIRSSVSSISISSGSSVHSNSTRKSTLTPHFAHNSWLYNIEIDLNDKDVQEGITLFRQILNGKKLNLNFKKLVQKP